jgi:hypothetical protein
MARGVAEVVEQLPGKCEVSSANPSTTQEKKNSGKIKERTITTSVKFKRKSFFKVILSLTKS